MIYWAKLSLLLIFITVTDSFSNIYTVINQNDSGAGSFRQAIINANTNSGADTIKFTIAGTTPIKINLSSSLTTITEQVMIDGWSQGGSAYAGVPLIEISGAGMSAGSNNYGLNINATNCTVRGLIIGGFVTGVQIAKNNAWIYACYIGTDNTGASPNGNTTGIYISNSASAIIGTNADGSNDSAEGNIISGNDGNGVWINQGSGHTIAGNFIGTDITGTIALANSSNGIYLNNSPSNTIGGISSDARNIISSNSGYGIYVTGSTSKSNWIKGNYIGLDITGSNDLGNTSSGIIIAGSANNNIIGSNGDGSDDASERNVVSCNDRYGNSIGSSYTNIQINGTGTSNNVIAGNYVGIAATGNALSGITGGNRGIQISSSANDNIVGGVTPETRNVLSGHNHYGVELAYSVTGCHIMGNYMGTDAAGTTAIPNIGGVQLFVSCTNNVIGTNGDGINDDKEGNLISGNNGHGVSLYSADQNKVCGNLIGTDVTGTTAIANSAIGIVINTSSNNTVGGTLSAERNIISGNGNFGVATYNGSINTQIYNNYIGTDITGTVSIGNTYAGVGLYTSDNAIGNGTSDGRNIISGGKAEGVYIYGTSANSNKVQGNYIGTDVTGKLNVGNTSYGVIITSGASSNILGTDGDGINDVNEGNLISCNYWSGGSIGGSNCNVKVQSSGSNNNIIAGNLIGTDITGKALITNCGVRGIQLYGGTGTIIGGTASYTRNIISGQKHYGIELVATSDTKIIGNYIGTDSTGKSALGNTNGGIQLYAYCYNNIVGTDGDGVNDAVERNLISGNGIGVSLYYSCDTNIVAGNLIGTDVTGITALANNRAMDVYNSRLNVIGGTTTESRNILSGNTNYGIIFYGNSDSNYFYNNYIGVGTDGTTSLSNGTDGIIFQNTASNNFIGGTGSNQPNIIANNGGNGINAKTNTCIGNSFRRNAIYNNTKLGIDLGDDGVTMDDLKDADAGANNLQNFPFIISASVAASSTTINGILYGTPNTTFDLEFFSNTTLDPSGYGEGMEYIGTAQVTTDNNGTVTYTSILPFAVADPTKITATATDPANNTSEFSGPYGDPLPVTLLSFDALILDNQTRLNWKVTEEKDILYYIVESSNDAIHFDSIGLVTASGEPSNAYSFTDRRTLTGENYFRLKIINKNNTIIYSSIKEVNYNSGSDSYYSIYPNPGKGRFNINYTKDVINIIIYDSKGIKVYEKETLNSFDNVSEELNLQHLSSGVYFVNFTTVNGNYVLRLNIIN